jgi:hypothetical protein
VPVKVPMVPAPEVEEAALVRAPIRDVTVRALQRPGTITFSHMTCSEQLGRRRNSDRHCYRN